MRERSEGTIIIKAPLSCITCVLCQGKMSEQHACEESDDKEDVSSYHYRLLLIAQLMYCVCE